MPGEQEHLSLHFIRSNYFRVVHADGAWGGITPHGDIQMGFYSERGPIPRKIVYKIDEQGRLGEELEREIRDGPVRELEVGVVVSLSTARSLRTWLDDKIRVLEVAAAASKAEEEAT